MCKLHKSDFKAPDERKEGLDGGKIVQRSSLYVGNDKNTAAGTGAGAASLVSWLGVLTILVKRESCIVFDVLLMRQYRVC